MSYGMLRRVGLVRSNVSEEDTAAIFKIEKTRAGNNINSWQAVCRMLANCSKTNILLSTTVSRAGVAAYSVH
jgi:hypothetical protein